MMIVNPCRNMGKCDSTSRVEGYDVKVEQM
jgi:hypothetical protein